MIDELIKSLRIPAFVLHNKSENGFSSLEMQTNLLFEQLLNRSPKLIHDIAFRGWICKKIAQVTWHAFYPSSCTIDHIHTHWRGHSFRIYGNWISKEFLFVQVVEDLSSVEPNGTMPRYALVPQRHTTDIHPKKTIQNEITAVFDYTGMRPSIDKLILNFADIYRDEIPYVDKLLDLLVKKGKFCKFDPGDQLLSIGRKSNHIGFLLDGITRRYTISNGDKEITLLFHRPGTIYDQIRFLKMGITSNFGISALTPSITLGIPLAEVKELIEREPRLYHLFYLNLSRRLVSQYEREKMLLSHNVKERYQHFVSVNPDLKGIKSTYIASYLGTTVEHLSRVRSQLRTET